MSQSEDSDKQQRLSQLFDEALDESAKASEDIHPLCDSLSPTQDRYLDSELVGSGGMKQIFKVFDSVGSRYVAMAKLHENANKELYDPFIREARLTGMLEHPNIMTIHDFGIDVEGRPYFTMSLKSGDSLDEVISALREGKSEYVERYPRTKLVEIFVKVCDAMAYAHSKGVLHLDLKPANIQIGPFGEVIICDWGLGKIIDSPDDKNLDQQLFNSDWLNNMTLYGEVKGTPGYMAPEQVKHRGVKTEQTDIYSLGCMLYSLLTYSHPLSGNTEEVILKTIKEGVSSPRVNHPKMSVPEGLNAVVMKATQRDPELRYKHVSDLGKDAYKFLLGFSTSAEQASVFRELLLIYRRNRTVANLCLAFLLIGSALIGKFVIELNRTTDEAVRAKNESEKNLIKISLQHRKALSMVDKQGMSRLISEDYKNYYENPLVEVPKEVEKILSRGGNTDPVTPLLFMMQRFDEYLDYYKRNPRSGGLINLKKSVCRKYQSYPKNEDGLLHLNDFVDLIYEFKPILQKDVVEGLYIYDRAARKNLEGYEKVTKAMLRTWNGPLKEGDFHYDLKTLTVKLRGSNIKTVSSLHLIGARDCLLLPLVVHHLDLRTTNVYDIKQLRGLVELKTIDIRDTLITDLSDLEHLPALEEIIVSPQQFLSENLDSLPSKIQLTYKP